LSPQSAVLMTQNWKKNRVMPFALIHEEDDRCQM